MFQNKNVFKSTTSFSFLLHSIKNEYSNVEDGNVKDEDFNIEFHKIISWNRAEIVILYNIILSVFLTKMFSMS